MTEGITNLRRGPSKSARGPSKAGRQAMGSAGRANLTAYHAKQTLDAAARVKAVEQFRVDLLARLGGTATGERLAVLEAVTMTFASILIVRAAQGNSRLSKPLEIIERGTWLAGSLLRLLKTLGLDKPEAKPRPRSLADLVPSKVAPNAEIAKTDEHYYHLAISQ